jgi:hypothetical protein
MSLLVNGNNYIPPTPTPITQFTYVVDSDQKLANWFENKNVNDYDYTSVLIKKGTWTYDNTNLTMIDLDNIKTSYIFGENYSKENRDSKIIVRNNRNMFNGFKKVTSSFTTEIRNIYFIVENNYTNSICCCFQGIESMVQCNGNILNNVNNSINGFSTVYSRCSELFYCRSNITYSSGHSITASSYHDTCFLNCSNLFSCSARIDDGSSGACFESCENQYNCYCSFNSNGVLECSGFLNCKNIYSCSSYCSEYINPYRSQYCYNSSSNIYNSLSRVTFLSSAPDLSYECCGYKSCKNLVGNVSNCIDNSHNLTNFFFYKDCRGMMMNSTSDTGRTLAQVFSSCYTSLYSSNTTAVADTANGGWNTYRL